MCNVYLGTNNLNIFSSRPSFSSQRIGGEHHVMVVPENIVLRRFLHEGLPLPCQVDLFGVPHDQKYLVKRLEPME